jgi:hypothetical protein
MIKIIAAINAITAKIRAVIEIQSAIFRVYFRGSK